MNTRPCKSCGMELIFAHNPETGKAVPLVAKKVPVYDIDADGAAIKVGMHHISHFLNCVGAAQHSKKPATQPAPAPHDEMPPVDQEPPPYSDEERYHAPPRETPARAQGGFGMLFPFGKHKNTPVIKCPTAYLEWCLDNIDLRPPLRSAIEAALEKKRASKGAGE